MKKVVLLFTIHFSLFTFCVAQKQGILLIDSLKSELCKAKEDTTRFTLLYSIATAYETVQKDSGINYGNRSLKVAEKLHDQRKIANAYFEIGNISSKSEGIAGLDNLNKALKIFEVLKDKKQQARTLERIGNAYSDSEIPKSLEYCFKALKIDEEIGFKEGEADAYIDMSVIYNSENETNNALDYALKALALYRESGIKSGEATSLFVIGAIYDGKSDNAKSLENYFKAYNIYEETGDKTSGGEVLGNIAGVYVIQRDYRKALEYQLKSLAIAKQSGDSYLTAWRMVTLNWTYLRILKDSDKTMIDSFFSGNKEFLLQKMIMTLDSVKRIFIKLSVFPGLEDAYYLQSVADSISGNFTGAYDNYKNYAILKDTLNSDKTKKKLAIIENQRNDYLAKLKMDDEKHKHNLQMLGIALFIITFLFGVILLSRARVHPLVLKLSGILALLMMFEFIYLLIDPLISDWTNDNPIYTLGAMVGIAAILIPTHHKLEHWIKEWLGKRVHSEK